MKKYISMPLRMSIASLTGFLVGPKVLSVASQTVLLHILGSRGSHIFLQIDHGVISKVILTPSAAQLQTFKNMTFFKMSKYDIRPNFECQNRILNVKVRYSASVRMPNMILIGYNINVLQQTACLVVNQITVGNFAFLFNCTPVGRTSDSMMVPT